MSEKKRNLPIIFEDNLIMIVNKPVGMLSHPDLHLKEIDILSFLKTNRDDAKNYAVINRLDYNTSGLVIIGKNNVAIKALNEASLEKSIQKTYLCAVTGYFQLPTDILTAYLLKDSTQSKVRISEFEIKNSQKIMTKYTVMSENNNMSLVEIELITGKTHQIRAHLAHIGHPIIGDPLYGFPSVNKKYGLKTQALCAYKLSFNGIKENSPISYLNQKKYAILDIPFQFLFAKK